MAFKRQVALLVMLLVGCVASAAEYPVRPIRLIVPFSPGGGVDLSGRIVASQLTQALGRQVVVDNRPGAAGNIGIGIVANSAADGYTLLMADSGFSTGVSLFEHPGYHPIRDFTPVSVVAVTPVIVVVHPSVAVTTIKELVAHAKAQPGKLNYGSAGYGGTSHLAGEMFQLRTGTRLTHVPYKGSGPAAADLAGGGIQLMFSPAPPVLPLIKAGRIRPLGVASNARSSFLPDLPTLAEGGVSDFYADNWYGMLVAARTPKAVVERLHHEIAKIVSIGDAREKFIAAALEPRASRTPQEFATFIKTDVERWAAVIKQANIKVE